MIVGLIALLLLATGLSFYFFKNPISNAETGTALADFTNMTDVQAQQAIMNAGLRVRFVKSPSDTVAANHVIRQNPEAGTKVDKDALIELVVSNGKPLVGLQDYRGFLALDAQRVLQSQGFAVTIVHKFDNSAKDNVIDQMPKPGTQVRQASRITLVVSNGPQPIAVPNFVGMSVENAQAAANKLGITLDSSQQVAAPGVPANTIASQDLIPGSKIDKGTTVHAVVSTGVQTGNLTAGSIAVPSVVGKAYQDAIDTIRSAGFGVAVQFATQTANDGTIIAQDPAGGNTAGSGATITVTLAVPGEVPDTEGLSVDAARAALAQAGYGVGKLAYTTTAGAGGRVVGTDPTAGTGLPPGSAVTLIVNGTEPRPPH
jgi:serine/threonine-protein kinase